MLRSLRPSSIVALRALLRPAWASGVASEPCWGGLVQGSCRAQSRKFVICLTHRELRPNGERRSESISELPSSVSLLQLATVVRPQDGLTAGVEAEEDNQGPRGPGPGPGVRLWAHRRRNIYGSSSPSCPAVYEGFRVSWGRQGALRVCPFPWPTWLWGEREKDGNFTSSPFLWDSLRPARSRLGNTGLERAQGLSVTNQGKCARVPGNPREAREKSARPRPRR